MSAHLIAYQLGLRAREVESPEFGPFATTLGSHRPSIHTELEGHVDGVFVSGWERVVSGWERGPLAVRARLAVGLDLGLEGALREGGVVVRCDEPARLGPAGEELKRALLAFDAARTVAELRDDVVFARFVRAESDDVRRLVAVAKAVEAVRTGLPMAATTAPHRARWEALAKERAWTFGAVPLHVVGPIRGVLVVAHAQRTKPAAFDLVVEARYRVRLDDWVHVRDVSDRVGPWPWSAKDPIVVTGADDAPILALPDPARDKLRALARAGTVSMTDEGLTARVPLPADPVEAARIIEDTATVAADSWTAATGADPKETTTVYRGRR